MSILGNRVIRKEDPHILTGDGMYVDSLDLVGARYVTFVRSTVPHALIRSIDTSAAKAAPGVEAVFTAAEVDIGPFPPNPFFPQLDSRFLRWPLAND
ncbi:MAG: xanthine dehydrogenase family protein molybdopterin-binding subunit, partial [Acidimicrobiales bacterium]